MRKHLHELVAAAIVAAGAAAVCWYAETAVDVKKIETDAAMPWAPPRPGEFRGWTLEEYSRMSGSNPANDFAQPGEE